MCEIQHISGACQKLQDFSVSKAQRLWLAFLASRRDSILVPTANCLGHKFRRRDDNFVDPNRDFPYSRVNNACLLSTTAKIVNRIMSEHIIQLVVTFHGGMVALGYEWGSKNHPSPNDSSPDDNANARVAKIFSDYGSSAGAGQASYKGIKLLKRIRALIH